MCLNQIAICINRCIKRREEVYVGQHTGDTTMKSNKKFLWLSEICVKVTIYNIEQSKG